MLQLSLLILKENNFQPTGVLPISVAVGNWTEILYIKPQLTLSGFPIEGPHGGGTVLYQSPPLPWDVIPPSLDLVPPENVFLAVPGRKLLTIA